MRKISIGRGEDNDFHILDDSVSRYHAVLIEKDGALPELVDLESRNGVEIYKNGRWSRVKRCLLKQRDRVRLGTVELTLTEIMSRLSEQPVTRQQKKQTAALGKREQSSISQKRQLLSGRKVLRKPRRNPITGDLEDSF